MNASTSLFADIRGLRYHIRSWGRPGAPILFLIHGWMDSSASFQFLVNEMRGDWHVLAPDWRGYGETEWSGNDTYWYGDFLGDLDRLLHHFQPEGQVNLVAHSFGANVASVYAGLQPARIARLVNIDAYGAKPGSAEDMLKRYKRWMRRLDKPLAAPTYASHAELEARLQRANPRVTAERISFIAKNWSVPDTDNAAEGGIKLRHDPAHTLNDGMDASLRLEEAMAAWHAITAPTLILLARQGGAILRAKDLTPGATGADRFACFQNSRQIWFEDTGHMMHLERPAELAPIIEDFIQNGLAKG